MDRGNVITISNPGDAIRTFRDSLLAVEDRRNPQKANGQDTSGAATAERDAARTVRIEQVRLNGSIPGVQPNVKTGEAIKIEVDYHASKRVEGATFTFELWLGESTEEPMPLMLRSSDEEGFIFSLEEGHNTAMITVPAWPLTDGTYFLNVGVATQNEGMMLDWKEKAVTFETVFEGRSEGILCLPYEIALRDQ
jgi:hypothetical protein